MLVNMYVFYDTFGNIKAITPTLNDFKDSACSIALFPLTEIEPFLLGKKSTFDYEVKRLKSFNGERFILNKKIIHESYARTLDNYLTEISDKSNNSTTVEIINQLKQNNICIRISNDFRLLQKHGTEEDKEIIDEILNIDTVFVYLTKRHNPYYHLLTIQFSIKELFHKEQLYFGYDGVIENASAYTKRIITGFCYKEVK